MSIQVLGTRSKSGIELSSFDGATLGQPTLLLGDGVKQSKFSGDGQRLAVALCNELMIYSFAGKSQAECVLLCRIPVAADDFCLSHSGTYLATFERPRTTIT